MAIETGAIFKKLYFDGQSSGNYGVYISGEGTFNAPKRDVEMVSIPGRNGDLALDKGRFENIEGTYKAGLFGVDEADFAEAISDFRNFLCSRKGYVRLEDDYNPDEYRMAVYKSGLEVDAKQLKAGEFDIVFDCKPQRWLKSGEEAVTIGEWGETETVTGEIVTIEATETDAVKSLKVALSPIQEGSGTPSPDNVRPISGHTEVDAYVTGKNLLPNDIGSYSIEDSAYRYITRIMPDGVRAYMSFTDKDTSVNVSDISIGFVHGYSGGSASLFRWCLNNGRAIDHSNIAASDTSVLCEGIIIYPRTEDAFNRLFARYDIMVELGSTATDYEPYQGQTYHTDLGQTVYGGTLDVVSGLLTVDRVITTVGELTWGSVSGVFYSNTINGYRKKGANNIICSSYATSNVQSWPSVEDKHIVGNIANGNIYIKDTTYNDVSSFTSAMSGVQLVYELAEPQTYTLTAQQVALLMGTNNVWSDAGEVTLEYGQNPNYLINPTLHESSPLLEVEGYGTIGFNGYSIEVNDDIFGYIHVSEPVEVAPSGYGSANLYAGIDLNSELLNEGDSLDIDELSLGVTYRPAITIVGSPTVAITYSDGTPYDKDYEVITERVGSTSSNRRRTRVIFKNIGSLAYLSGAGPEINIKVVITGSASSGVEWVTGYDLSVSTTSYRPVVNINAMITGGTNIAEQKLTTARISAVTGYSTVSVLGHPTYVDCEAGEGYRELGSGYMSLNRYIDLGSDLPKLAPGPNEVTHDDAITELKVLPRWWKV